MIGISLAFFLCLSFSHDLPSLRSPQWSFSPSLSSLPSSPSWSFVCSLLSPQPQAFCSLASSKASSFSRADLAATTIRHALSSLSLYSIRKPIIFTFVIFGSIGPLPESHRFASLSNFSTLRQQVDDLFWQLVGITTTNYSGKNRSQSSTAVTQEIL